MTTAAAGYSVRRLHGLSTDAWQAAAPLRAAGAAGLFVLDGGLSSHPQARWSFLGAWPSEELCLQIDAPTDPWETLARVWDRRQERLRDLAAAPPRGGEAPSIARAAGHALPPFPSGGVALLSYDLGRRLESLPSQARDDLHLPALWVGFHDAVCAIDHATGQVLLCGLRDAPEAMDRLEDLLRRPPPNRPADTSADAEHPGSHSQSLVSTFNAEGYRNAVRQVRQWIARGHVYQANIAQRFEGRAGERPSDLYGRLRQLQPVPFGFYCEPRPDLSILSVSPERFLRVRGRELESRPIKGTRPRSPDPVEDARLRAELRSSEKDRAELAMIVDLVRNDLGRVASAGSVEVASAAELESYASVHHLVGVVRGRLRRGCTTLDAVRAAFPAGSITGAPKIRAMEIIEELEPVRRGFYTGSLGYLADNGDLDLNVAIRTLVISGQRALFHVGAGIVWDSTPNLEYSETLHKGRSLFELLGGSPHTATLDPDTADRLAACSPEERPACE